MTGTTAQRVLPARPTGTWPLALALIVAAVLGAGTFEFAYRYSRGHIGYSLDDAYIHMAIARHFAERGVWGITPYEFSHSSSAPLWTLLVAGVYRLVGVSERTEVVPGLLNLAAAVGLIVYGFGVVRRYVASALVQWAGLLGLVLAVPVVPAVFWGMEHTLFTWMAMVVLCQAAEVLARTPRSARARRWLPLTAALLVGTRYEGLFLIAMVGLLLLLQRRVIYAGLVGVAAVMPVAALGLVAMRHGAAFLPNTLIAKGNVPLSWDWEDVLLLFGGRAALQLLMTPVVLGLCVFVVGRLRPGLLSRRRIAPPVGTGGEAGAFGNTASVGTRPVGQANRGPRTALDGPGYFAGLIFLGTTLLHVQFSMVALLYSRYETYLVAMGLVAAAMIAGPRLGEAIRIELPRRPSGRRVAAMLLATVWLVSLMVRSTFPLAFAWVGTVNIYHQQYQMGRFLDTYYTGRTVCANDVGAISYLADIRVLDLVGLGSLEVVRAKRAAGRRLEQPLPPQTIAALAKQRGATIAIIYDAWFEDAVPSEWTKVGEWTIRYNVTCGDDTVAFYAVDPAETDALTAHLRDFRTKLHKDVVQRGRYMLGPAAGGPR